MIGSAAGIDFTRFLVHMAPPVALVWIGTILLVLFLFRRQLSGKVEIDLELDERKAIKDRKTMIQALTALGVVVILFFLHHRFHLYPAYVALIGLVVGLVLARPHPEALFGEVHWSVLVFFAALFAIVGGVEHSGLLALIGDELAQLAGEPGMLLIAALTLMWVAAILSAIVDNIPFTVAMIPIIQGLETQGVNITPLWWALALGVGLGGNGTHIGATANIIAVSESEKTGDPESRITPATWMRAGLPAMLAGLTLASAALALFFDYFT
jgi:Na+/H+ antiporter NhaD/arsenite permease-like protein